MPKTYTMIALLTGLALSVAGCDSQASQQAEAQRHLDAALAKLQKANAGYIAEDAGEGGQLLVYRQDVMESALNDLNSVMSLNAPSQKVQALQMSADIDISAARHATREASLENAALNARSTVLLGYLSAMEGAADRAESLKPQTEKSLSELQAEVQEQTTKRDSLTATIKEMDGKLQTEAAEVQQYQAKADEGYAQAQAIRDKAFVARGDKKYDLQDQAAEAERAAAVQSASAERHQVVVDNLTSRINLAQLELDTVEKLIAELNEQITTTRADSARQADQSDEAATLSADAVKTMSDEYTKIARAYDEMVHSRMTKAAERVDKAIGDLKQAASLASGTEAESVSMKLLAAYVDQANIATEHAAYAANLAHLTGTLLHSVQQYAPESAGVFKSQLDKLNEARVSLDTVAGEAIAEGLALAEQIAPEGSAPDEGGIVAIALQQKDRLNGYENRRRL